MAYIYCITNKINGKQYVGQTNYSTQKRWKEHLRDAERFDRPLYRAIHKYGKDNFIIDILEETNNPNEKEMEWINKLNTYHYGYNATKGGEGKILIDRDEIIRLWLMNNTINEISKTLQCCVDSVHNILKDNNITAKEIKDRAIKKHSKPIMMLNKDRQIIKVFPSAGEAARYLGNDNYAPNITRCANGIRKTANGYIWVWK